MPNFDQTGPLGNGLIGRGRGFCENNSLNNRPRFGFNRRAAASFSSASEEKEFLQNRQKWLTTQIDAIVARLKQL